MGRPSIEPHLQRLLTDEHIVIGSLFQIAPGKPFYCSLYAPGDSIAVVLAHDSLYAYAEGDTPEDAVYGARDILWKGL